jgi:ribosomal protein S18 acetylase RimI-like enzyme
MSDGQVELSIRQYSREDEDAVIKLWESCNLTRPWNNPRLDIERKLTVNPELLLVGSIGDRIIATVMGGYEGHRGWINYLAVDPVYRKLGFGKQMMNTVEERLLALGCPKINLQIRTDNFAAAGFYHKIGYKTDEIISMGKRLIED